MDVVIGVTVVQLLRRNNRIYCADSLWRPDWDFRSSLLEVWIESSGPACSTSGWRVQV